MGERGYGPYERESGEGDRGDSEATQGVLGRREVPGTANEFNQELEKALRLADFLELGELIAFDGLNRNESCGGHFRVEYQTPEGEALRDDEHYAYAAVWEYTGADSTPVLHKEELKFEAVHLAQRTTRTKVRSE